MSKKWTLSKADLTSIAANAAIMAAAAVLPYLAEVVADFDFGSYTPIAQLVLGIVIKAAQKFVTGK